MVKGSAPGHTAFNGESGIGPPCFVLSAWPVLSAVGVGTPFPVPPGVPFSEAGRPAGLSHTALYLFMGSEGQVAIRYQPGVARMVENTGGGGRILSIGDRLHGGHLRGRRGHRSRSPLHSTVAPFEFFYKEQVYYLRNYISQLAPPYRWFKKAKSTKHVSWGLLDGGIRGDSHVVLHAFLCLNMFPKQACGSGGFQPQGTERPSSKCIMQ